MKKSSFSNKLKILLCLCFIFLVSSINAQEAKELLSKAITENSGDTRGIIKEDEGAFRLDFDEVYEEDSQAKFLQEKGFHGGGPSWLGIIYGAFAIVESDLAANLDSDVSVTGVSFWCEDKENLEKIRRVLSVVKSDEKILMAAIEIAKQQDLML